MDLKVTKKPKCQVELEIEVSSEELEFFYDRALKDLSRNFSQNGFRQGKVPKEIIEKELGPEKILLKAAQLAVEKYYFQALEKENLTPISPPEGVEILKLARGNPLVFKIRTSVLPEVPLPDYKKISSSVKKKKVSVSDSEIEENLRWLQRSRAKFQEVKRGAQKGDFVELEFSSPQINNGLWQKDSFILGEGRLVPGFEKELEGLPAGSEKEFTLLFPEKHFEKNLAGKKINFKVKIKNVQEVIMPELNDEFAQKLGNFSGLSALKKSIREGLQEEKEAIESQRRKTAILEAISQASEFDLPEILVEKEKERLLADLKFWIQEQFKISFSDYLKQIGKNEEDLNKSYLVLAEKRVRNFLLLREIAQKENIEVTEEEITQRLNEFIKHLSDKEKAEKEFDLEALKAYNEEVIRNEKTLQKLETFCNGD